MIGRWLVGAACAVLGLAVVRVGPAQAAAAGDAGTLAGVVTDTAGAPLAGVQVVIVEARRNTLTDRNGRYRVVNLPEGSHVVTFAAIGYRPETRRVTVAGEVALNIRMVPVRIELAPLQVTATADASGAAQSPQPTTIVPTRELRAVPVATLGAALENLPGVRNLSTGQSVGKPVIRGLSNTRVLVLEDGMRLETAQWGDEHGSQVEALDAERIEVIRGPASVLYGSDALGGVVNVVPRDLPDAIGRAPFAAGRATLGFASGATARDGGVLVEAAAGPLGARAALVGRHADDLRTPAGALFNSGLEALNAAAAAGVRGAWGHVAVDGVHRTDRIEIHEDPAIDPGATPYQRVRDDRVRADAGLPVGTSRLELRGGWERNRRREFESGASPDVALELLTTTYGGEAHLHHLPHRGWNGILGLAVQRSELRIGGEEALVPAYRAFDAGVFAFEQRDLGPVHVGAGLRADARRLDVDANTDLGVAAQRRSFHALSGSLGALVPVGGGLSLVANLGRAWRAPSPFELFANGVHEGTARFEVGDSTLEVESALNADVAIRWQTHATRGEVGVFANRVANFIYAQPTAQVDSASGFPIYRHTQGDAVLAGLEAAAVLHPLAWLELDLQGDYVYGQNTTADRPLPQIPPLRISATVRLETEQLGPLRAAYLAFNGVAVARVPEHRRDPDDAATGAYQLVHVSLGGRLPVGAQQLAVDAGVRNALDTTYRDFLSRTKRYADEMGRSVFLRLSAEF